MKVVIIEDEPLMAEDLAETLVQLDPSITIAVILPSVQNAIAYLKQHNTADLIFSDIQLGDGLSFEIFKEISVSAPVVFCTAYDEYALDAFKANGIDYVLKPFTDTTIQSTLNKYKQLQQKFTKEESRYQHLLEHFESKFSHSRGSILVYQRDKIIPLAVSDVAVCYVDNQITKVICFDQRTFVVNHTMDELERLLGAQFFRANRQQIINRKAVKEASQFFGRKLHIALNIPFQEDVIVSKAKSPVFLNWLVG
ncbi:response regulator transcription factor [Pontibacter sp. JH31]|uniref:Response regulator transcription factor n=1 Tax=Pontibacter aquaedesilientis TaxID=2766980 RepID=A0ABR7XIP4_9BACT|nr:LytTR family DNA-binding domain-containing protein [Pontibacter aquaedesilientis]MBD1398162.1 response regulator transcription factor [Pontibacter aquaedesilientis]